MVDFADKITFLVEGNAEDEVFGHAHASLPRLRGRTRVKRISTGVKREMVELTAANASVHTPRALVAACNTIAKVKKEAEGESVSSASSYVKEELFQYYASGRQLFEKQKVICLAVDGCRVSNEETDVILAVYPRLSLAAIPPPQVHFECKCR